MWIRSRSASRSRSPSRAAARQLPRVLLTLVVLGSISACRIESGDPAESGPWPNEANRHLSWQWQLTGTLDLGVPADILLLDPVRTTSSETAQLRKDERRLVCQVSAGTYLTSDPDSGRFPSQVSGAATGPHGSRWLDVRQWQTLEPILADRLRLCRGKGFEAVALANLDGYAHRSGFPLTFDDQLVFNRRIAQLARSLKLPPGLVNDVAQATALAPDFDFAVNEECVRLRQCAGLLPFVQAGKIVLHVEYAESPADFCVTSVGYGFSSIRKRRELDAWRLPCPTT